MKGYLPICALLLALCAIGWTTEIRLANNPSVQVCPNDTVIFVCNITQTNTHLWIISSTMVNRAVVSTGLSLPSIAGFEFSADGTSDAVITKVQFSVTASHTVTCINGGNSNIREETNITLFGFPSSPLGRITLNNVSSLNLIISKPSVAANCVRSYSIDVTSSGSDVPLVSPDSVVTTPAAVEISNLSMCEYNYTVKVVAFDLGGRPSEPFVKVPRITLEDIMVMETINSTIQPNGDVSISYEITLSDCANFTLEFIEINLNTMGSRSIKRTVTSASTVNFEGRDLAAQYMCDIYLVLPSMHTIKLKSFDCSARSTNRGLSMGATIGIAVVAVVGCLILIVIFSLGCWWWFLKHKNLKESDGGKRSMKELESKIVYDSVTHSSSKDGSVPKDQALTYQAPETIQRQAAGPTGVLYTVVGSKGNKGSKKAKEEEELPKHSAVDKNKKNDEEKAPEIIQLQAAGPTGELYTKVANKGNKGSKKAKKGEELPKYSAVDKIKKNEGGKLVYSDIDVQKPKTSHSRYPPAARGVTQADAIKPVVYST